MSHIFENCLDCEDTIMSSEVPIQLCEDCFDLSAKEGMQPKSKND
tara:strand:- start:58 stop:192 length:135 start_codon:yes stop_codon:yes gene_type:complete